MSEKAQAPFRCSVGEAEGGQRLDRLLAARGLLPTRSRIAALVREGLVTVDGRVRKASFLVSPGETIEVRVPEPAPLSWVEPEDLPLEILHEDAFLVVVNKPSGMAAHPAPGCRRGTLVAALLHRWQLGGDWPDPQRPGIVHRLDKDTTGVMVVAKTPAAMHALARQFARRTVEKTYRAIVIGCPREDEGLIDLPIGRDPIARHRMQARSGQQREARTRWKVLERFGERRAIAAWLELRPETGRTHQLRVHLASIGHPIAGDPLYGGAGAIAAQGGPARSLASFPRQALHAATLRFRHPEDGSWVEFEAPPPADVVALLDELRRGDQQRISDAGERSRGTSGS